MSNRSVASTSIPGPSRRRLLLAAMAGSASMIMLDQTVVAVALSTITREQALSAAGQQWVVNAYGLAVASFVAFGGRLADRFGGARIFRIGVVVFATASLACGLAPATAAGQTWIIVSRALQGVGAALMIPVSAALVVSSFPVTVRGRAMAVYTGISQIFLVVGPLIGGVLTEQVSWRAVFWLNTPIAVVILVLLAIARPDRPRAGGSPIRSGPVALLVGGLASLVLALQQAVRGDLAPPATATLLAAGAAMIIVFVRHDRRAATPLLHLDLLTRRAFSSTVVVLGLVQFALLATVVFAALHLQDTLGLTPTRAGMTILAFVLPIMAAAQLGGWWYDRRGLRGPVLCGLTLVVIGMLVWAGAVWQRGYASQLPGMVATGAGLGLTVSPCYTDALGRVDRAYRGQASGVIQTVRQLGGILGILTIGSVVTAVAQGSLRAAPPDTAAHAVAVGFVVAAAFFTLAVVIGAVMLPRSRLTGAATGTPPDRTRPDDQSVGPSDPSPAPV